MDLAMITPDRIKDLDRLLDYEAREFTDILTEWASARELKDWKFADKIREEYSQWDESLSLSGIWHPAFENPSHRESRAFKRMSRYKVDIYP